MADSKITALTELTAVVDADVLAIVDDTGGTPITKKITRANLLKVGTDIAAYTHSHALGTDTTGNYVATVTGGTGITSSVETGETAATTITLDLGGLTDDSGQGDTSGWSTGDFLAMVEGGGTEKKIMPPAEIGIAASDDTTTLTTGDKTTIMIPRKMRVTEVKAMLVEATSMATFKVDLQYHATDPTGTNPVTIFPAATFLEVAASSYSGTQSSFDDGAAGTQSYYDMAEDSFLVVNINSIGDGTPKGLKIWLLGYWN